MKVQPLNAQNAVQSNTSATTAQADARARAIAKLVPQQPEHHAVNPSNISPEEMSAIIPPSNPELSEQISSNEDTQETVVAPTEEPKVAASTEAEDTLAKQHQALARRERQLRDQARKHSDALKLREEALKAREAELQAKTTQYNPEEYIPKALLKSQTLQALAEAGISYDEVVQQAINQQAVPPQVQAHINQMESKLKRFEQQMEESQKSQKQQQDAAYQAAVKQIEMDAKQLVNKDPSYEAIRKTKSTKDVVELITRTFDEEGRVMSVQEAADEVENYLVEQIDQWSRIEKIKKRLNLADTSKPVKASPVAEPTAKTQTQPMKTLTNASSSTRKLNARDRAIAAFKGDKF